jgi:hypothetical protein
MDIINNDIFIQIISEFKDDYVNLKKLSETSKNSNHIILNETNFKEIVKQKRDRYNCKMLESNLESFIHIKFKFGNISEYSTLFVKTTFNKNKVLINKYIDLMNNECIQYLYEFIECNYLNRSTNIYNNTRIPITISKDLYKIILCIDKNYVISDNNIVKWLKIKTGITGLKGATVSLANLIGIS